MAVPNMFPLPPDAGSSNKKRRNAGPFQRTSIDNVLPKPGCNGTKYTAKYENQDANLININTYQLLQLPHYFQLMQYVAQILSPSKQIGTDTENDNRKDDKVPNHSNISLPHTLISGYFKPYGGIPSVYT